MKNISLKAFVLVCVCCLLVLGCTAALAQPVRITMAGDSIECSDPQLAFYEDAVLHISFPGEYELSGNLTNGQILVNCVDEGKVTLFLNGVTLHHDDGPAIYIGSCSPRASIQLVDQSVNQLSTGSHYTFEAGGDEPDGVIFSRSDLTLAGTGALNVSAGCLNGIVSKDDIRIKGGSIVIDAPKNGLVGKDSVEIFDGCLSIHAGNDGIKSTSTKRADRGYVDISGGEITIACVDDAIVYRTFCNIENAKLAVRILSDED